MIDVVFLNGTVGVGKTTTARALSRRLTAQGSRHAIIDLDQVRQLLPPAADDPFQHEVELANLHDLAKNYRRAGAARLIVAGVVEDPDEVPRYREAVGAGLLICRIVQPAEVVERRLRRRHQEDPGDLGWHLSRHVELTAVLDRAGLDDAVVDATGLDPTGAARRVAGAAGW